MENSLFGEHIDFWTMSEIVPVKANGATSDVYKVRISGKWHFLKRPKKKYSNHPLYNAAFEKEFNIGYTLDHPNIVRYISHGNDETGHYLLTEYVDGFTLTEFISSNFQYFKKTEHLNNFIRQLLSALSYLHDKQILHLDLKPDNILITNIGKDVKIIDLGFAYTDCYQFLATGKTNQYAAPEQINNGIIDQRTDIYGVGMILLYVFTNTSNKEQIHRIPSKYRDVVRKCLETHLKNRFINIPSIQKELILKEKRRFLLKVIFAVSSICLCLFIYTYFFSYRKPNVLENSEIPKSDTIKQPVVIYDTVIPKKQEIQKTISQSDILKKKIQKIVKGYFSPLYSLYKSADNLQSNRKDAQILYSEAVSLSFKLMDSLSNENPSLSNEDVRYWVRVELDKNANLYLSWLSLIERNAIAKNDSIF